MASSLRSAAGLLAVSLVALVAAVTLVASTAGAQTAADPKGECVRAYTAGQKARRTGGLRAAHADFLICAQPQCPTAVTGDCTSWAGEVEAVMPSVIVVVRREGHDVVDATVMLDGTAFLDRVDGRAHEIDPGEHVLRASASGQSVESRVLIREGEKRKVVTLDLPGRIVAPAPEPKRTPTMWPAYATTGAGVLGLGAAAFFGATALTMRANLLDCAPACGQDRLDAVSSRFVIADVSLAVGILSLGAATYFWLRPPSSPDLRRTGALGP